MAERRWAVVLPSSAQTQTAPACNKVWPDSSVCGKAFGSLRVTCNVHVRLNISPCNYKPSSNFNVLINVYRSSMTDDLIWTDSSAIYVRLQLPYASALNDEHTEYSIRLAYGIYTTIGPEDMSHNSSSTYF